MSAKVWGFETGVPYYWKRTGEWKVEDKQRWWEIYIVFDGYNGTLGAWFKMLWRYNGNPENIRTEIHTWSRYKTGMMVNEILEQQAIRDTECVYDSEGNLIGFTQGVTHENLVNTPNVLGC